MPACSQTQTPRSKENIPWFLVWFCFSLRRPPFPRCQGDQMSSNQYNWESQHPVVYLYVWRRTTSANKCEEQSSSTQQMTRQCQSCNHVIGWIVLLVISKVQGDSYLKDHLVWRVEKCHYLKFIESALQIFRTVEICAAGRRLEIAVNKNRKWAGQ